MAPISVDAPQHVDWSSGAARQSSAPTATRLPSFNGWRGISILLVLGLHVEFTTGVPGQCVIWIRRLFDGLLGVRFFFTISGFLITWLMLREEKQAGFVSLKNFYARRALRIFPVYFACLAVLALLQFVGVVSQTNSVWLQLLTFTRNFQQHGHAVGVSSLHFWSLAVEEQFYLLWPLMFISFARSRVWRLRFLFVIVVLSWIWKTVALLGCYNRHLFFLFQDCSTFLMLDSLAYGCIGAILFDTRLDELQQFFKRFPVASFLFACFFLIVPEIAGLGIALQTFAFGVLLLQSVVDPGFAPFRFLNNRWLVKIGILSYSLYVWQQLVYVHWPLPRLWFLSIPAAFLAGWLSYRFLEKPFFSLREKLRFHVVDR